MKPRGKILVVRGGAIGDFVLTLPVLAALRQQFPEAHLEVLGYSQIAQLAAAGGLVDQVRSIEARALAGFFARRGELDGELSLYFNEFSIIISYLYDPDEFFQQNVLRCSNAQFILGPHRPDETQRVHATEVFLKPLERLAIFGADAVPQLKLNSTDATRLPAGRWLVVHPGSGSEKKNWPEKNWSELLGELTAHSDFQLLLVGGEAEGDRLKRLAAPLPVNRVRVMQSVPLAELAAVLRHGDAFVGHDSGITHLAAALGLPNLVLWGDTVEEIWRPRSPGTIVLKDPRGLAALPVKQVFERVLTLTPTR